MKRDTLETIAVIILSVSIVGGAYAYIQMSSDVDPTFTTVESQSMQHSRESRIGIIDTGDMVVLKNKEKYNLQSYVDGRQSGYATFGEYGNVVVYDRGVGNPVIHRIMLWLDYDSVTNKWSAPSLKNYDHTLWECDGSNDWNKLSGNLRLFDVGYSSKTATINLDILASSYPNSGFLTMGDNRDNYNFDQSIGISKGLVTMKSINSVAWIEIPWGGVIKVMNSRGPGVIDTWVPNAIPCMALGIIAVFFVFLALNNLVVYHECSNFYKAKKRK